MDEALTSIRPAVVFISHAAVPAVKTTMTFATNDPAARKSLEAVNDSAQSDGNWGLVASIQVEQDKIATARPEATSADPSVNEAVIESALAANEDLRGRRQDELVKIKSDTTGAQAAASYDLIAKMTANTQPAAIATSTRSTEERVFSGGLSLEEFTSLPQKAGPRFAALNADFASNRAMTSNPTPQLVSKTMEVPGNGDGQVLFNSGKILAPLLRFGSAISMTGLRYSALGFIPNEGKDLSFLAVDYNDNAPVANSTKKSVGAAALTLTPAGYLTYQNPVIVEMSAQARQQEYVRRGPDPAKYGFTVATPQAR